MWIPAIKALLGMGGSMLGSWAERKKIAAETKAEVAKAIAAGEIEMAKTGQKLEGEWDNQAVKNQQGSWKDEYILILFSIPLIMCFIPGMDMYVHNGFAALDKTPVWYQGAISVIVAGVYGMKKFADWRMNQLTKGETNGG
jgi:hypothetical protein